MSELDRQRAQLDELREDLNAHEVRDDERFDEICEHLRYIRKTLEWLVKAEKGELA